MRATHATLDDKHLRDLLGSLAREAQRFRFAIAPNPSVGACILSGTREVARGHHEEWGREHAEVRAFEAAARSPVPRSDWDTLVVTLEPCSTHGKQPPCTDLIASSGIRRVVVGSLDPDPRHRGAGLNQLREAGIEVEYLEGASPIEDAAPFFTRWTSPERRRRPRPWTIAKWAQTRTGQLVPPPDVGGGRWISGAESQAEVQHLRGRVDAILTGVSTVLADDPRYTVRSPGDPSNPPMRVVLDSYLRTPADARLFEQPGPGEGGGPVHILCQVGADAVRHRALVEAGAQVTGLTPNENDHVRLRDVQTWLWEQGIRRLLVESGPTLLSRHLELGFVDQLRVYTGNVNGGEGESMAHWLTKLEFDSRSDRECGEDSVFEAFLVPKP